MTFLKTTLSLILFPLIITTAIHKYYVSTTQIEYVDEKKLLQIITRINADDLERVLQERYDDQLKLTTIDEKATVNTYLLKYLNDKFTVTINTQKRPMRFIGKEYDNDEVVCYFEIEGVDAISTIEINNEVLFDLFPEQKNVIKTNIGSEIKNLICTPNDKTQYLNFE